VPSYAHKKILEKIAKLDQAPDDQAAFSSWIEATEHLDFLKDNGRQDEVIVYAAGPYTFIHSMIVPNSLLSPPDEHDLLSWSCNPYTSIASYISGGGRKGMWIERGPNCVGSRTLAGGASLIFGRDFEGWSGPNRTYFEVNQEYTHLSGIHWRSEQRAYCNFDDKGDIAHLVSVSLARGGEGVTLVSFSWRELEIYLAAADSSLVRMYNFTLLRRQSFSGWPDGPERIVSNGADFFYRKKVVSGFAAYTRGIQILGCRGNPLQIIEREANKWRGKEQRQHVEFLAYDWRNTRVTKISTDPSATTNYFEAKDNDLPFELSPAFFKPEVLLKYKADRDKYTIEEREITCRTAWHLRGFDVNKAGQVHAYICYLRNLPYSEQLHWLSFNEEPKESISERAHINDFKGEWTKTAKPLQKVISILRRWQEKEVPWWKIRDPSLIERVSVPYSASKDEWAESFMALSKLLNEGFEVKNIRNKLTALGVAFEQNDGSIVLLEKLCACVYSTGKGDLPGLRAVQRIRSKVKGHSGSSEAMEIIESALSEHETFAAHFEHVCDQVADELANIETVF
jgi:hypothetical protein